VYQDKRVIVEIDQQKTPTKISVSQSLASFGIQNETRSVEKRTCSQIFLTKMFPVGVKRRIADDIGGGWSMTNRAARRPSILARLTTRPAMTLAGIVINCSRDERSQFCAFGRLEN
jgi:hypothetical protein